MMEPSNELKSKEILTHGGAFRIDLREGGGYRYYFVLNKSPESDSVLVVSTSTTQFASHESKFPGEVLVYLTQSEYPSVSTRCLINCEQARAHLKVKLMRTLAKGPFELLPPLPESILERIRTAVAKCKVLCDEDKELILGVEDVE